MLAQLRRLRRVGCCFVVEGDNPRGAQNGLAQPAHPNSRSRTPIASCRRLRGIRSSSGPSASTMSASSASPATAPSPAGRQPRTVPTASTIVSASTASTSELRNAAEMAGAATVQVIISPRERFLLGPTTRGFVWQVFRSKADLMTAITAKSFRVCRTHHAKSAFTGPSMPGVLGACPIARDGGGHAARAARRCHGDLRDSSSAAAAGHAACERARHTCRHP